MKVITLIALIIFLVAPIEAFGQGCARYQGYRGNLYNKEKGQRFSRWLSNISKSFYKTISERKLELRKDILSCTFSINSMGEVIKAKVKKSNYDEQLNKLAIKTIMSSKPLPPDLVSGHKDVELKMNFNSNHMMIVLDQNSHR